MTTSGNEWYNKPERMPTSDNTWKQGVVSGNEWYNEWKPMRASKIEWL